MGNFACCQEHQNTPQIWIDQLQDKQSYSNINDSNKNKQTFPPMPRLRSKMKFSQNAALRKIKKIQSRIKGILARMKFIKTISNYSSMLRAELKANLVEDFNNVIKNHKGEILSKAVEAKYGKYIIPNHPKYKYTVTFKPVYITKNKTYDIYAGSWNINKNFQGYGSLYKADGSKFEGMWIDGKLNGKGRYFTNSDEYYIGDFVNGIANGEGSFCHADGTIYNGTWVNDQPEGEGEEIYKDGSRFKGNYLNGKKVYGKFQWEDGSYYEGGIKNDKFQGKGTYYWKEGRTYSGEWCQGQMDGNGLFTYLDGSYYEGEFHNGLRNGQGRYVWNENKNYVGGWLNGKQHGKGRYIKGGKVIEGIWINGKLKTINYNSQTSNSTSVNHASEYTATYTCENNDTQLIKVNNIKPTN